MRVSLFAGARAVAPEPLEVSWPLLVPRLRTFSHPPSKLVAPAWSPAEYRPGESRGAAGVAAVWCAVFDLDDVAGAVAEAVVDRLERAGVAAVVHTTWSHAACAVRDRACLRVVIPLSSPVAPEAWPVVWRAARAVLAPEADETCKDAARLYFLPSCPLEDAPAAFSLELTGAPLDVERLPGADSAAPAAAPRRATLAQLRLVSRAWDRSGAPAADLLASALRGEPVAPAGRRDDACFLLAVNLAEALPEHDPASIAELLRASLDAAQALGPGGPGVPEMTEKIARRQAELTREREDAAAEAREAARRDLRAVGRAEPYSEEELRATASDLGYTRAELDRRWVVQRAASFYFLLSGAYEGPFVEAEAAAAARAILRPAEHLRLERATPRGVVAKTPAELVREYGIHAARAVVDLTAPRSRLDVEARTVVEAPCPPRALEPAFSPLAEDWLRAMAGPKVERLLDWVATVVDLGVPSAALLLTGPPGVGKTLFASGLARLWADAPTTLEQAMGEFNSALCGCPLVLGDELVPRDFRGEVRTAELRQFIQARERPLRRKFLPDASLRGAVRVVLAANNEHVFQSGRATQHTRDDVDAIVERFLHVRTLAGGRAVLRAAGSAAVAELVRGDGLARHALWLRSERRVESGARFAVEGDGDGVHEAIVIDDLVTSAVLHWLVSFLVDQRKMVATRTQLVRVDKGRLCVNSQGLVRFWPLYETNVQAPPSARVSAALAAISLPERAKLTVGVGDGSARLHYRQIDPRYLRAWLDRNDVIPAEELDALLNAETPNPPRLVKSGT